MMLLTGTLFNVAFIEDGNLMRFGTSVVSNLSVHVPSLWTACLGSRNVAHTAKKGMDANTEDLNALCRRLYVDNNIVLIKIDVSILSINQSIKRKGYK